MKSFGDAGKKPFLVDNRSENVEKSRQRKGQCTTYEA